MSRNGKEISNVEKWNKKKKNTWIEVRVKHPEWDKALSERRIKIREKTGKMQKQDMKREW